MMSAVAVPVRRPANKGKAMALALLVHVVLLALVGLNWRGTTVGYPPQNVMQAIAITELPRQKIAPVVDDARQRAKKQKQKIARQKAQRLKKRKIARRRAAIAKRKIAAKKRHQQAQDLLQQQLASEESERSRLRRTAVVLHKAARFIDKIGLKVSSQWRRPPGSARDAYCVVRVRITPGGRVLSVMVVRSSGDAVFDRATENAIYLAEPLPVPRDAEVFEVLREFNIDTQKL